VRQSVIYVVGVAKTPVKIGYADSLASRLSSLQVGNPDQLVVHYSVRVPFGVGKQIESLIHEALIAHHRRGEWFDVDALEANRTVQRIASEFLEANRAEVAKCGDLIDRVWAEYPLDPDARGAWLYYQKLSARTRTGPKFAALAQGFVLKRAGQVPLNLLRLFANEDLDGVLFNAPTVRDAALANLAKGLNALSDFVAWHRQEGIARRLAA
jgi:hypothetical protein